MTRADSYKTEIRLFLPRHLHGKLRGVISKYEFMISMKPCVNQRVYFMDDNHDYYFKEPIQVDRYLADYSNKIQISKILQQEFSFENICGKYSVLEKQLFLQKKDLEIISGAVGGFFLGLRPYFLIEYHRSGFSDNKHIDITIDDGLRFYYFVQNQDTAICIKDYEEGVDTSIIRIKISIDTKYKNSAKCQSFIADVLALGAKVIISKRQEAFNLQRKWIESNQKNQNIKTELQSTEIEAKISITTEPKVSLFSEIHSLFGFGDYALDPVRFRIISLASINHYFKAQSKDGLSSSLKILSEAMWANPVMKGPVIKEWSEGLLERYELNGEAFLWQDDEALSDLFSRFQTVPKYIGFVIRSRKLFYVINKKTQRSYCISIDKCVSEDKPTLFQIEIEYSGKIIKKSSRDCVEVEAELVKTLISEDIFKITQMIEYCLDYNNISYSMGGEKLNYISK